jgi:sec-independent protein translocase protein TatC
MRVRPPRKLGPGEEATLVEHLDELRTRLVISGAALVTTSIVAYVFHRRLVHWISAPLPHGTTPTTLTIAEPFLLSLKISLWAGLAFAFPIIVWQLWSFLAPAVDPRMQRTIVYFVVLATVLLASGITFGYFIALPAAVHYLTGYDSEQYNELVRAQSYFSFAVTVLVAMGMVFELPIFVVALVRIGVLTTARLRRNRRLGYFIVCCIGVALPGIDPFTTTIETIPLLVLYEGSILLSVLLEKRWGTAPADEPVTI